MSFGSLSYAKLTASELALTAAVLIPVLTKVQHLVLWLRSSVYSVIQLRLRTKIVALIVGILVALGLFVNTFFLFAAFASSCGLIHLLGGHQHGGTGHTHDSVPSEKEKELNVNAA